MFYYKLRTTLEMLGSVITKLSALQLVFLASFLVCCFKVAQNSRVVGKIIKISFGDDSTLQFKTYLSDPSWGGYTDRTLRTHCKAGHDLGI